MVNVIQMNVALDNQATAPITPVDGRIIKSLRSEILDVCDAQDCSKFESDLAVNEHHIRK